MNKPINDEKDFSTELSVVQAMIALVHKSIDDNVLLNEVRREFLLEQIDSVKKRLKDGEDHLQLASYLTALVHYDNISLSECLFSDEYFSCSGDACTERGVD